VGLKFPGIAGELRSAEKAAAMSDDQSTTPPVLAQDRPGPPPLRIHHILACIAVTAVLFTMVRMLIHDYSLTTKYIAGANGIAFVVLSGVALTLVGFGFAWHREGLAFFNQPGHWLLLLYLEPIAHFALSFLDVIIPRTDPPSGMSWLYSIGSSVITLACLVCVFVAAWKGFQSRWWRAYFLMQGLLQFALPAVALWSQSRETLWAIQNTLLLSVLTAAAFADWRAGRRRDWVNWTGVAITALSLAKGAAVSLWPWMGSWPN
jgi:hypothetical protein